MNAPALKLMSAAQFHDWCVGQEGRWELVGGMPTRAMTGATRRHDTIAVNLIFRLRGKLGSGPCSPHTAAQALRIDEDTIRRPDVTIDCGPTASNALESSAPTVAFEVLSPSTHKTDRFRKLEEYKTVASLMHVALIDPDKPIVLLFSRREDGAWGHEEMQGLEAALPLSAIGAELPLAEIYEGLAFEPE